MIKKLTLLAAAVAALAAFVVPASASAAEWKFEGEPLKGTATLELHGSAGFTAGTNGAHATLNASIHIDEFGHATLVSLKISNCTGTGGLTGLGCEGTVEKLPWAVHCTEDALGNPIVQITSVQITNHYIPALAPDTTLTGNVIATPGEGGSLNKVSLSGEGTKVHVQGVEEPVNATIEGSLEAATAGYSCS